MHPIASEIDRRIRQTLYHCGQTIQEMTATPLQVSQKGLEDYVTNVDLALNQILSVEFAQLFPEDGIITEENAASRSRYTGNYARLWCIDPLDGTEDFIRGKWEYAVMVGLLEQQQPIAGWLYAPAYHQLYCGGRDWGVFQVSLSEGFADQPLLPIPAAAPSQPRTGFCPIIIGYRDQKNFGTAIARHIPEAQVYSLGSFGLKVMEVVLGRAGLYLYFNGRVKLWDTVGPLAIAQAAGLVCCDLEGQPIRFSPDALDLETLAHQQPIVVGWAEYIERLLPKLRAAVRDSP